MYTWGDIKEASLAKLGLTEDEASLQGFINAFPYYADEVITQICSTIKPKASFQTFVVTDEEVGTKFKMNDDFVSFGDDVNYRTYDLYNMQLTEETHDDDLTFLGYNEIMFKKPGTYQISYNARWFDFVSRPENDRLLPTTGIDIPMDIVSCIPPYIASQCYKVDDEYKSSVFRNEYEIALARIDDTNYKNTKTFKIGGDW